MLTDGAKAQGGHSTTTISAQQRVSNALTAAFLATEEEIRRAEDVDATGSGSTASLVYLQVGLVGLGTLRRKCTLAQYVVS